MGVQVCKTCNTPTRRRPASDGFPNKGGLEGGGGVRFQSRVREREREGKGSSRSAEVGRWDEGGKVGVRRVRGRGRRGVAGNRRG